MLSFRQYMVAAVALALFAVQLPAAAKETAAATHDGQVVRITSSELVMTAKGETKGEEHTHALAPDTAITLDGKTCQWSALKAGQKIRVTTRSGDATGATAVEAIEKQSTFANTQDGKVVSMTGEQLVMSDQAGQKQSLAVNSDAKVTCDGVACKAADLKAGMRIRVTTQKTDVGTVIEIEALNKNAQFA